MHQVKGNGKFVVYSHSYDVRKYKEKDFNDNRAYTFDVVS